MTVQIPCDHCQHGGPYRHEPKFSDCDHNRRHNERAEHLRESKFCHNLEVSLDCHYYDSCTEKCDYESFPECYLLYESTGTYGDSFQ